ncbi:MAG TPA: CRISPR-associated endonuclease Cas2 [Proteobacteria bacterium]|nr:CRISPR-associated endonuclease Cas2 [Pseudomonadota bacterium]
MKQFIVVAYDIADDKRRNKIYDVLSSYGQRANYSVFECFLSEKDIQKLKGRIGRHLKKGEDIVLYYYLCRACLERRERAGNYSDEKSIVKVF